MSDSQNSINDASAIIFRNVSECMSRAQDLPACIGDSAANDLIEQSVVHTEVLADGRHRQILTGADAPMAARFINALLFNSGATKIGRRPLGPTGTVAARNREVYFTIPEGEERKVIAQYQAAARWLVTQSSLLTKIYSTSILADRDRGGGGQGTKITPNIIRDGANNSLALKIETNEPSLITALKDRKFYDTGEQHFRRSNTETVEDGKVYKIYSEDVAKVLDIVNECFSPVGRITGSKNGLRKLEGPAG